MIWIIKLISSPYKKKVFGGNSGTKSDFERFVGISPRNKDFRLFLDSLIENKELILTESRKFGIGNKYSLNVKKIMNRIEKDEFTKTFYKACADHYLTLIK